MDYKGMKSETMISPQVFFENQLLSYKQAAQYLCISEPYLRRLKAKRQIPFVQLGLRGIRFRVSSLNHWIEKREIK
jgi:excisionase family DNA binding protein